jgi:ElaB/YqjD/DUF883 family membrane-anchored ribosome-binding protein
MTTTTNHTATTPLDESARVRSEIDDTREHLGQTVEAISDRVSPSRIIERRKESTTKSLRGLRDRVMGSAHDSKDHIADSAGSALEHVRDAPGAVAHRTEGSPLAAGGVAFAVGILAAALWRPTEPERHAVEKITDAAPDLTAELTAMGTEAVDTIKHEAHDAAEELKTSAADAGSSLKAAATNENSGS